MDAGFKSCLGGLFEGLNKVTPRGNFCSKRIGVKLIANSDSWLKSKSRELFKCRNG